MDMDEQLVGAVEELAEAVKAANSDLCDKINEMVVELIHIDNNLYNLSQRDFRRTG